MNNARNLRALIVCKYDEKSAEAQVCKLINHDGFRVKYSWKNSLTQKDLNSFDLVISIGGDGTALSASHYLTRCPLLAVNSAPLRSEGALATITVDELNVKLEEIKTGRYKIEKLERIDVLVNGKKIAPLALNEVFMANEKAYLMSRYRVRFHKDREKIEEVQRSSGVIFSTGTGSTAWFKSAGGKPFSPQAKYIKMVVREPYRRKLNAFSIVEQTIREGETADFIPLHDAILVIDSIREFQLKRGDQVTIRISRWPLLRIR